MKNNNLHVVFLPQTDVHKGNPYWQQLQASMENEGAVFVETEDKFYLQWRWLLQNRRQVDVIHLHFLKHHYTVREEANSLSMLVKFVFKLLFARLLGYELIWTVHNLYPHEKLQPVYVERLARIAVAQLSTKIIVHCDYARDALAKAFFRRRKVYTLPHPNYITAYPNTVSKSEARTQLNIPEDKRVILFQGAIRPYKGINLLVDAFKRIDGDHLTLLIAGKPDRSAPSEAIQALAEGDARIKIFPYYIPDDELQIYFNAADLAVLPYTNVLSSGSALLAMSFGCPIIAPAIGCLPEVVQPGTGILYDVSETDSLYKALLEGVSLDLELLGKNAYEHAKRFRWETVGKQTLQVYQGKLENDADFPPPFSVNYSSKSY